MMNLTFEEIQALIEQFTTAHTPEAPASLSVKVLDKNGFDLLVTVRDTSGKDAMEKWAKFSDWLIEHDYQPAGDSRPAQTVTGTGAPVSVDFSGAHSAPAQATETPGAFAFAAEILKGSRHDGKTYWKVIGPAPFHKYGVTIWPEVLQSAGFEVESLNPDETYSLAGHTATYTLNDKGKPGKVTSLVK